MEDMKATEIEFLRQTISRTDKSGNEKLFLLMDFIYVREQALSQHDVIKNEVAVCDVCGSDDITEAPHMGKNCNSCNPL